MEVARWYQARIDVGQAYIEYEIVLNTMPCNVESEMKVAK